MKITMDDSRILTVSQIRDFLKGSQGFNLSLESSPIEERYKFIDDTVDRLSYVKLHKKEKKIVTLYLKKITGYQKAQIQRLIKRAVRGKLTRASYHRIHPVKIYTTYDIKLLEKTDELHLRLSEQATKEILRREKEIFKHQEYQTISKISHAHITNLRHSPVYLNSYVNQTKPRVIPIGITQKPENYGKPGSIRVDVVFQREVFHINSVDEITQWEVAVCVPEICEACMLPALQQMIDQYPFVIFNFHSDRGKECINYLVADLLNHLLIKQTKSRSYHCNDNALVETKNGSVIRKNMGWMHINQNLADEVNIYFRNFLNPYLVFHRPCGFPTIITEENGKKKKVYDIYQTPYEALKNIKGASKFLRPGQSFEKLDIIAYRKSDNEFAEILRNEERKLFNHIMKADNRKGSRLKS